MDDVCPVCGGSECLTKDQVFYCLNHDRSATRSSLATQAIDGRTYYVHFADNCRCSGHFTQEATLTVASAARLTSATEAEEEGSVPSSAALSADSPLPRLASEGKPNVPYSPISNDERADKARKQRLALLRLMAEEHDSIRGWQVKLSERFGICVGVQTLVRYLDRLCLDGLAVRTTEERYTQSQLGQKQGYKGRPAKLYTVTTLGLEQVKLQYGGWLPEWTLERDLVFQYQQRAQAWECRDRARQYSRKRALEKAGTIS